MERAKRIICMTLCFAMLAGYLPAPVHAEDLSQQGLCEHHPEHIDCSYAPGVDAVECGHQHDGTCYVQEENCIHVHDSCGTEDTPCEHICSEDTGCVTVTLNCQHEHGSDCGYADAADAVVCNYLCAECNKQEEEIPCDGTLNCAADEHSEECEKKAADDLAAEQEATQKAAEEHTAVDQAAADVSEIVSGTCGDNLTWLLDTNGTLTISGTGAMKYYGAKNYPWHDCLTWITHLEIEDGVSSIADLAFDNCFDLESVSIPDSVRSIGSFAFRDCINLKSVIIPAGVTSIESNTFDRCTKLESVTLPEGLISIGSSAFNNCDKLNHVTLPEGIKEISSHVFYSCDALAEITIPASVTAIWQNSFSYCSSLTKITFQGKAPKIYENAFYRVTADAYYPEGLSWTEDDCQNYGGMLTWVSYEDRHIHEYSDDHKCVCGAIGGTCGENLTWTFDQDTGVLTIDGTGAMTNYAYGSVSAPWHSARESILYVSLPNGLTTIGDDAFDDCPNLTSITIPDGVTYIGNMAFAGCRSMTSITIPESVTTIGWGAFFGCDSIESITLPSKITTIENLLFYACDSLTHITIPEGVTSIGNESFSDCTNLSSVTIPDSVTFIDEGAFLSCSKLTSITIPNAVTMIGESAFSLCSSLTSLTIPRSVEKIGYGAFIGCTGLESVTFEGDAPEFLWLDSHGEYLEKSNAFYGVTTTIYYPANNPTWTSDVMQDYGGTLTWVPYSSVIIASGTCGENLTWILDVEGVLSISGTGEMNSFLEGAYIKRPWQQWANDIRDVIINDGATSISAHAFYGCGNLKSVNIPDSVECIEYYAFADDSSLVEITFGNGLREIGALAFQNCTNLSEIVLPESLKIIEANAFSYCSALKKIYIPNSVVTIDAAYSAKSPFYKCSDNLVFYCGAVERPKGWSEYWNHCSSSWKLVTDTKWNCAKNDYYYWSTLDTSSETVIIPNGITTIPDTAFMQCVELKKVLIPESVTNIGSNAFYYCNNLIEISIPNQVSRIGDDCFYGCAKLNTMNIPDSVTIIGNGAFTGCDGLTKISIPASVTNIGDHAFFSCVNLSEIVFSDGVLHIGEAAFSQCRSIKKITIPDSVMSLGSGVFRRCTGLESVYIPDSVTTVKTSLFFGCSSELKVYCEAASRPDGWSNSWNEYDYGGSLDACWGCSKEEYEFWCGLDEIAGTIVIPDYITVVPNRAFSKCGNHTIIFQGAPPRINSKAFSGLTAIVYYPADDPTWTSDMMRNYGGTITWEADYEKFAVTLDAQGGTIYDAITEYAAGIVVQLPTTVMRSGYIFQGWYEGDTKVTEIPADATGDKAYTARWQEKVTVELDTRTQRFDYDGNGKEFVLKDADGNILPSFNSQSGEDWFVPCNFAKVIAPFGERTDPMSGESTYHQGIDLAAPLGTPVYASRSGQVSVAAYNSSAGYYVQIDHLDGFSSTYMHLSYYDVSTGENVFAGQLIGYVGQTGVAAEPHLHFGIRSFATEVDPGSYVNLDKENKFCIDYTYSGMPLNENGLPCEAGTYNIRITIPETATHMAVNQQLYSAVVIVPLSGDLGSGLTWAFDKAAGKLTVSGSGWMRDYSEEYPAPWSVYAKDIRELDIRNLDAKISEYAFAGCSAITSVTIPDSIYQIGNAAFSGCTALEAITFAGDSPSFDTEAFAGVTATVHYPAGWYWNEDDLQNYGGNLTWIEDGVELRRLTLYGDRFTHAVGQTIYVGTDISPWNASWDFEFTVSDPDILEIVSQDNRSCIVKALAAGTASVTVIDSLSGLEAVREITVIEPQSISCPYTEELSVPEENSVRYYQFTPEEDGWYCFSADMIDRMEMDDWYGSWIDVIENDQYVEGIHRQDEHKCVTFAELNAGISYLVPVTFDGPAYAQTSTFSLEKVSVSDVFPDDPGTLPEEPEFGFYTDSIVEDFLPGENTSHALHINNITSDEVIWSSSNPAIIGIEESYSDYCWYKILNPGTATITASCNGKSDSVTITVTAIEILELYVSEPLTSNEEYISKDFGFMAPEDGRYVFTASSDSEHMPYISFNSWSSDDNISHSYGTDYRAISRDMYAGEICRFHVNGSGSSCSVRVSKAASRPLSMQIVQLSDYPGTVSFGTGFNPRNSSDRIVKWEINDPTIAGESSNPNYNSSRYENKVYYNIYKDGKLTVTATSESGLKASLTVDVRAYACQNGHTYGEWVPVLDENGAETGSECRKCESCGEYQQRRMPPLDESVKNRIVIDASEMAGHSTIWIDGVEYTLSKHGDKCYVDLPDGTARTMVTYTYNSSLQTRYPVGMKVWMLENVDGIYTATRQESFDDILQYSGMSIRVTGKKGIRMITGIEQSKKNALTSDGLEGFTLKEYGTAIAWASQLGSTKPLTLGRSYVKSNYAYKKGVADPVFAYSGNLMQYTNVLVNFSNEQCKDDIAMRPYMILEDENGDELTIYGGIVNRSIGYIAYQNRNVFEPQTDEYNYIWDIIHYVYGDVHDDEFIHAWTPSTK